MKLKLLHGPNLSQLGSRDRAQYGTATLAEVVEAARSEAQALGHELADAQTEYEGELVTWLHETRTDGTDALILNAGAWTHYSYAIRDALEMLTIPKVELHLSNLAAREQFRQTSVIAPVCNGAIAGFGADGYPLAVRAATALVQRQ